MRFRLMVNSILLRCILWRNNDIKSASLPWQLGVLWLGALVLLELLAFLLDKGG